MNIEQGKLTEQELSEQQLEKLEKEILNERGRLSSDRMDISFGELISLYKNGELIIRPEYQRLFRWNNNQKTALIESLLLGIPIPPIFVAEDSEGIWELVDGLQRVSTFISFFGELNQDLTRLSEEEDDDAEIRDDEVNEGLQLINKWKLEPGGLLPSLEGLNIDTISNKFRINLKRAVCRVEILRGESNTDMKYELFKRLNSGGSKLTPQEIRNAIFRGINAVVNELLLELSKNEAFKTLTNLSPQKKQELYDQELILRFIALLNNGERINDNLQNLLDRFMERSVREETFDKAYYTHLFEEVISLIKLADDNNVFRNERNLFVPALYEGITIGIAQNLERYKNNTTLLQEKIKMIKSDETFKQFSGSASNSRSRIRKRLKRAHEIFAE